MKIIGLVYAKWCPHCTAMKPQWDIMKSKLRPNCRVVEIEDSDYDKQTKLDNLNNDIKSDEKLQIHGYPTMFKINNGKVDYYNGSRDSTSMESFFNGPKQIKKSKTQKKNKTKKGKKSKKNKTKKMKGGEDKKELKPHEKISLYILIKTMFDDTTGRPMSNNCGIVDDKCFKPNSKSDQKINICESKVYKGPSKGFKRVVKPPLFNRHADITIDPQTMNLLVQTVIKKIAPNRNIEQYDSICHDDNKYEYALVGKKFSSNKDMTDAAGKLRKAISVEEYIEAINKEGDTADKQYECNKIIGWLRSVFENLDFLFEKIQFHHCDPKAAQLLLDGDTVILGDLDKVTFTLNINKESDKTPTPYRMRIPVFKRRGGTSFGSKLKSLSSYNPISISEPEKMRFESKPRKTNIFEKAAFMASILLQLNEKLYKELINAIKNTDDDIKRIYDKFINKEILKIKRHPNNKQKKNGHAIASICVDNTQVNQEKKELNVTLKSNASLVEKKDGDLVIEYNWW